MKRTTDPLQPAKSRRSLLRNLHPELLTDPSVVAFIGGADPDPTKHLELTRSFVMANEPPLLQALLGATGETELTLSGAPDDLENAPPLPDGLLDYFAEHINELPAVTSLLVSTALLTPAACARLQTSLQAPGCKLVSLGFTNCAFEDPHAAFIAAAPTITDFTWSNEYFALPRVRQMDRVLPALAHWPNLECVTLRNIGAPLNFADITQMLLANPNIEALRLFCDTAPAHAGDFSNPHPENPYHLFERLRTNHTGLNQLHFQVSDPTSAEFNSLCVSCVSGCLMDNTTLQALLMPGITLSSRAVQDNFVALLDNNRSLTLLGPPSAFGRRMPRHIEANANRHIWFSHDFLRGAVSEFMRQLGAPKETGTVVAQHLYTTPYERTLCAAIVAQLCKATNESGIRMRSTALALSIKELVRGNDKQACLGFMHSLSAPGLGLLPADKADVVAFATRMDRLDFLPAGYAH